MSAGPVAILLSAMWKARRAAGAALDRVPLWPEVVRLARWVIAPVTGAARVSLRLFPFLRRAEPILELESLTRRHPVPLAFALLYVAWRGLQVTKYGHVGTDTVIYPFLAMVSGLNPCLGAACGACFGVADLVQKLYVSDIYGALDQRHVNYWPAMGGYIVSYSAPISMGLIPGVMARVCRLVVRAVLRLVFARRSMAHADGAGRTDPPFSESYDAATNRYRLDMADPAVLAVIRGLAADPRAPMATPQWQRLDLSDPQRLVLMHLEWMGLLAPSGRDALAQLVNQARLVEAAPAIDMAAPAMRTALRQLIDDPRGLLTDPDRWRTASLTPDQRRVLAHLRSNRQLGPGGIDHARRTLEHVTHSSAVGATISPDVERRPVNGGGGDGRDRPGEMSFPLAELIGAVVGGAMGGRFVMESVAPALAVPAFMWRPQPDVSCLNEEVHTWLVGRADVGQAAGGGGGALTVVVPPLLRDPERPAWSLANRPSVDHVWDDARQRWVPAAGAHAERMQREGYEFDRHTDSWRRPPPAVEPVTTSDERTPVVEYQPFSFEEPSTTRFERRLDAIDEAEQRALDEFRRLDAERDSARASGDVWLAEQLTRRVDAARDNVRAIQGERSGVTDRANREADYDRRIAQTTVGDAAAEIARLPLDIARDMVAPDMSGTAEAIQRGIEARNRLQGEIDANDARFRQHDDLLGEYRRLHDQVRGAASAEELARLRAEAARLRDRIDALARDMQRVHDANRQYQRRGAEANYQGIAAAAGLGARAGAALDAARSISRVVTQYQRGNLPGQPGLRGTGPDDVPLGGGASGGRAADAVADGSAASPEAISRMRFNRIFRVDTRTGAVTELHGVDAVDVPTSPHEVNVLMNQDGRLTATNMGRRVTGNANARQQAFDAVNRYTASDVPSGGGAAGVPPPGGRGGATTPPSGGSSGGGTTSGGSTPPSGGGAGGAPPPPPPPSEPDLGQLARRRPGEPASWLEQRVAAAEARADALRRGEPLPDAGRHLPTTRPEWTARDIEAGIEPGPPRANVDQILGIQRPPEVDAVARWDPDFRRVDDLVRDAYKRSGGGFAQPGDAHWRYERFEAYVKANGVDEGTFDKWLEKIVTIKYSPGPTQIQ